MADSEDTSNFDPLRIRRVLAALSDTNANDDITVSKAEDNLRAVSDVVANGEGNIPPDVYSSITDGFEGDLKTDKLAWNRYLVWRRNQMLGLIQWCDNKIKEAAEQQRLTPQDVLRYRSELMKDMYEASERVDATVEKPPPTLSDLRSDVTIDITDSKEDRQSRDTLRAVMDVFRREIREKRLVSSRLIELDKEDEPSEVE